MSLKGPPTLFWSWFWSWSILSASLRVHLLWSISVIPSKLDPSLFGPNFPFPRQSGPGKLIEREIPCLTFCFALLCQFDFSLLIFWYSGCCQQSAGQVNLRRGVHPRRKEIEIPVWPSPQFCRQEDRGSAGRHFECIDLSHPFLNSISASELLLSHLFQVLSQGDI